RMTERKGTTYSVSIGLLYPSALGAALAWLVPAAALAGKTHGNEPVWWSVLFGFWFVLYHAIWFVYVLHASEQANFKYLVWPFLSDLVDIVAIFLAFWALGLATPPPQEIHYWAVYLAAGIIPVSAIIHHRMHESKV